MFSASVQHTFSSCKVWEVALAVLLCAPSTPTPAFLPQWLAIGLGFQIMPILHRCLIRFTNRYVYTQVFRTTDNHCVAQCSTSEQQFKETIKNFSKNDRATCKLVGETLLDRLKAAGVNRVHWAAKRHQKLHGNIEAILETIAAGGVPYR